MNPKKLTDIEHTTLKSQLEEGKVRVIIVDGLKKEAQPMRSMCAIDQCPQAFRLGRILFFSINSI